MQFLNSLAFELFIINLVDETELAGFGVTLDGKNPTLSITSISMNGVNVCGGSSPATTTAK
jgi:hypothetical protein